MSAIDLYFITTSRVDFEADLHALGLMQELADTSGAPHLAPVAGVDIDYIGQMVQTPAEIDMGASPPVVVVPAVMYAGERANLRLTGPNAEAWAAAVSAASFVHGTVLIEPPESPRRVWA